jgi:hypothetical protein
MGAKLKSKIHLQNTFFEPFFARLASEFSKSVNMTKKTFFLKIKQDIKTQDFTLISNPLKKLLKNAPKSYKQNKFDEYE